MLIQYCLSHKNEYCIFRSIIDKGRCLRDAKPEHKVTIIIIKACAVSRLVPYFSRATYMQQQ